MKRSIPSVFLLIAVLVLADLIFSLQEVERKYLQVVNIEMLVRVMKDGKPLSGLKKGDFSLLENGRNQEINGFLEVHRRMTPGETAPTAEAGKNERPGRLFLLFFWINEPAVKVDEVLDYFFKSIYREGDRVILADQRHSLEVNNSSEIAAKAEEFKTGLVVLCDEMRSAREKFKLGVEFCLQVYIDCLESQFKILHPTRCDPENLAVQYRGLLKEYRLQSQTPNADRLEALSRSLEAVDADKWALVFFQHDFLPLFDVEKLKLENYHLRLGTTINSIEKANHEILFPEGAFRMVDSLRTRFIQANAQFHLLLLGSQQAPTELYSKSRYGVVNPFPVFSKWEETFRQISEATGGKIMDGTRMKEALAEVANREDVYYVLTYAPDEGKRRERRIDINVDRDGVKVIHGRRVEMESLPQIKLAAIEPVPGMVRLELENFYMIGQGEQRSGLVRVSLSAARENEKPQVLANDMEIATAGSVEIPITKLPQGRYRLEVQVVDRLTGRHAQGESMLDVLGEAMDSETVALLRLAADYSARLRQAAFRFICRETVNEDVLVRDTIDRSSHKRVRMSWLYEYQVLVREEKVIEDRVLLRKNKTKKRVENAVLETRFRSLYSAFLPATLFAADKQSAFFYRLEKHEKMYGRPVARLAVAPRPGFEALGAGTAWVDEATGAVLKIELSQRAIKGIETAEKRAQRSGARLLVSDVHVYGVEHDGIWLPSSTTISEYYVINVIAVSAKKEAATVSQSDRAVGSGSAFDTPPVKNEIESPETPSPGKYVSGSGGNRQFELSRTWVEYSDFKFFVVDVQTKEQL